MQHIIHALEGKDQRVLVHALSNRLCVFSSLTVCGLINGERVGNGKYNTKSITVSGSFGGGHCDVLFWSSSIVKMKVGVLAPTLMGGRTLVTHSYLRFLIYKPWSLKNIPVYFQLVCDDWSNTKMHLKYFFLSFF